MPQGRPTWEPDDEQRELVQKMAGFGITQAQIAGVLGVDVKTLRKHCRKELDTGGPLATAKVAESLYNQAIDGNVSAAIFWMKARAGWSERVIHDGTIKHDVSPVGLSETDRLLEKAAAGAAEGASQESGENRPVLSSEVPPGEKRH